MPLYHQVSSVLRQRIGDGTYPPGHRLPPEDALATEFEVSRATIRQAVGELVGDGLIARQQGRGTFVLENAASSLGQAFRGTITDLLREVRRSKVQDLEIDREAQIPARIATELQLEQPSGTIIRRVRLWDDQPFAYTVNYLPESIGKMLGKRELRAGSLMQLLEEKGLKVDRARQTIRAELADVTVSGALGIPLGAPVLSVERCLSDAGGQPIEFVRSWYRGDLYEYTVTFDRGDSAIDSRFA